MLSAIDKLCKKLNYSFSESNLLELALSHRSVSQNNNERLEFLGDAVLGCVIADDLFNRFPAASEGELTRLRASLVKGDTLAEIGRELQLGDCIRLGAGELKSGGFRRDSILASGVEAIIGAVHLDGGDATVRKLILHLFQTRLEIATLDSASKDPKTRLQELLQARKQSVPVYELLNVEGEPHAQTFYVRCDTLGLTEPVAGRGSSRRKAEQNAAKRAYKNIIDNKVN